METQIYSSRVIYYAFKVLIFTQSDSAMYAN